MDDAHDPQQMGETTIDWASAYREWVANLAVEAGPEEVLPLVSPEQPLGPGPVRPSPSGNRKNKTKVHVTYFGWLSSLLLLPLS